ncbi:MAG TPA: thiamine pyrophosphate-dependent enzyme [Stellaceae bacterium]|jgi:thiamine pyrophosphate-dependent acetolactate synthase large subunit-like protein|nr:thiamine pyrophosphate-dependent enzyme [Stellaceae bacterium]
MSDLAQTNDPRPNDPRLERRAAMRILLAERGDLLLVTGLGSTTYDAAAAGDDDRNFYLWGAMGAATMIGLGLAIAQPERRVLVVTGDGEILMGLGTLATVGVERPPNLAIAVFDNGHYGETGMQASHTNTVVDLCGVARACGLEAVYDIAGDAALQQFTARLYRFDRTMFARVAIRADDPPRVLPTRDGVALKNRFRHALGVE